MSRPQRAFDGLGLVSRGARAWVRFCLRRGPVLWVLAGLLFAFGVVRTTKLYLGLRSDLEQLLPRQAPSVLAIDELRSRVSGLQYLGVVVDTGTAANLPQGERMLDDLAARIRTYPPTLARAVRTGDGEERKFLEKHAALYIDEADLRTVLQRLEARRDWEVSQAEGSQLDETPPPPLDFSDIERRYDDRASSSSKAKDGRFSSADQHVTLLLIEAGAFSTAREEGAELFRRVREDVAALGGPDAYAKGMRVGYSGDIAISVEETSALVSDLALSSTIVAVLVVGVLYYFFRWWRALLVILPPLAVATVLAFGVASIPPFGITELNSNTAFLGAIIVGNGINVGIMLLSRYVEERRAGRGVEPSIELAVWSVRRGTFAAAMAASMSYASLVLTEFRGFRQFGIIGGLGMLLAWGVTFTLFPALVRWVDRGSASRPKAHASDGITGFVSGAVKRWPAAIVLASVALTAVSAGFISRIDGSTIEQDFSKLRRRDTWKDGEGYWGRRMDTLLGVYLTPIAVLADTPEEAQRFASILRERVDEGPLAGYVTNVRTIDDVLPTHQDEKLALVAKIRHALTPRIRASIPADKKAVVERIIDDTDASHVTLDELPRTFTTGLREKDGAVDRVVLVFPRARSELWEGRALSWFVGALRDAASASAYGAKRPPRVAGALALSADILDSIRRDGVRASVGAFLGVVIVVLALFRWSSSTPKVLGALLVGVTWMLGLMLALGMKINFANFIAFPITFGIGVEYAVNVMTRYVQEGSRDVASAVRAAGGAVALCSATTIIGYSSLLIAQNQALFLFGCLAVIGEITCLVAAVVSLPAWLEWRRSTRATPIVAAREHG